jgi:hypothetical protein
MGDTRSPKWAGSLWILKFGTVKFGKLWGEMDEVIIYFIDQAAI